MICYKDMTFCPFHKDCETGKVCDRALTDKVQADADAFGLPIAQFIERPECHMFPVDWA